MFNKWAILILIEYLIIMIPFPFFYTTEYVPWMFDTPNYIWAYIFYNILVIFTVYKWVKSNE